MKGIEREGGRDKGEDLFFGGGKGDPREVPGRPREAPGRPQGGPRDPQEGPPAPRSSHEVPGCPRI